MQANKQQEK